MSQFWARTDLNDPTVEPRPICTENLELLEHRTWTVTPSPPHAAFSNSPASAAPAPSSTPPSSQFGRSPHLSQSM
ncbi:hypothetical protein Acr_00g0042400 [Actinidia rufa]|uniref:Uncharacterized protein n=1 Tax=Actinidia rufa TaxID=165716 RepID=A0A7J0DID1_9ERIC|nr:hypothetical protein Acr_00g0042400 [Actinidia rufa]